MPCNDRLREWIVSCTWLRREYQRGVLTVDPELKRNAKNVIEKIHQLRDSL